MKRKFSDLLTVILFCGFLGIMSVLLFALPKEDFSENEKRYMAEFPKLTWETLSTGKFGSDIETYMADHIPGRNFFVGLNAYVDKLTGRQISKDIYTAGDRLVEAPAKWDEALVAKNMGIINAFAEKLDRSVDLMIVPSAGWAYADKVDGLAYSYQDAAYIEDIYSRAGNLLDARDILSVYAKEDKEGLYFKTDHHWTALGAYLGYKTYMESLGREYREKSDFRVEIIDGFYGSTYSRSALWLTDAEPLEMWHGSENLQVTNAETAGIHEGVFYTERLEEADKYTVYLDGNHSLVRIDNPDNAGKGKLLVIRDSYSNCLGTFLAESYETVILVDLRYYKNSVSELCIQEYFDDILVCYSIGNFLTDTNLVWLR